MDEIIVGIDGSEGSARGLRWAVEEGALRGWPVTAVMAWGFLDQHHPDDSTRFVPDYGELDALATLDGFVVQTVGAETARGVGCQVPCELPAVALLRAAEHARLLVVGARGLGGFRGLLLGSVSQACLHHAPSAVAVVREGATRSIPTTDPAADDGGQAEPVRSRVVVGIDGSPTSREALRWAYEEAELRGAAVEVVHAWHISFLATDHFIVDATEELSWLEAASRKTLDASVDAEDASGLCEPPERSLVRGSAASAILDASEDADLVVVGARGFGGFAGLLLGSVSQQVARHAHVPVVVVPHCEG